MSKCDICGDSGIVTTEDNGGVISQDTCPMGCALPEPKVAVEDTASVADTNPVPKTNPTPKNDEPIKCHACGAVLDIRAIMREKGRRAGRLGGLKMTSERARKNQAASVIARARNKAAKAKKVKA